MCCKCPIIYMAHIKINTTKITINYITMQNKIKLCLLLPSFHNTQVDFHASCKTQDLYNFGFCVGVA